MKRDEMEENKKKMISKQEEVITCADIKQWQKDSLLDIETIRLGYESNRAYVRVILIDTAISFLTIRQEKWDYGKVQEQVRKIANELIDMVDDKWSKT